MPPTTSPPEILTFIANEITTAKDLLTAARGGIGLTQRTSPLPPGQEDDFVKLLDSLIPHTREESNPLEVFIPFCTLAKKITSPDWRQLVTQNLCDELKELPLNTRATALKYILGTIGDFDTAENTIDAKALHNNSLDALTYTTMFIKEAALNEREALLAECFEKFSVFSEQKTSLAGNDLGQAERKEKRALDQMINSSYYVENGEKILDKIKAYGSDLQGEGMSEEVSAGVYKALETISLRKEIANGIGNGSLTVEDAYDRIIGKANNNVITLKSLPFFTEGPINVLSFQGSEKLKHDLKAYQLSIENLETTELFPKPEDITGCRSEDSEIDLEEVKAIQEIKHRLGMGNFRQTSSHSEMKTTDRLNSSSSQDEAMEASPHKYQKNPILRD